MRRRYKATLACGTTKSYIAQSWQHALSIAEKYAQWSEVKLLSVEVTL